MTNLTSPRHGDQEDGDSRRGVSAATMLTVYLVLLLGIPSNLTLAGLASLGRPSFLFGLILAFWWVLDQLQSSSPSSDRVWQPVRYAFLVFFVIVLISFAAALLRGQPPDQISPARSAILRIVSWGGVLFVTMDGIRTPAHLVALVRRLTIGAGLVAALGVAQFIAGQSLLGWVSGIPGISIETEMVARSGITRAAATATHPLEYAVIVTGCLPFGLLAAMTDGFRSGAKRRARIRWWIPVMLMTLSSLLSVSRSALIGLAVAVLATLPAMSKAHRRIVLVGGALASVGVTAVQPGVATTTLALFLGGTKEASAQSRSDALARLPGFLEPSPLVGQGFGTFLPRYYIFDDQWALMTVEAGIIGVLAFASIAVTSMFSATRSTKHSQNDPELITVGRALVASILTISALFAFFDALSFPISAGMYFFCAGLAAALRRIAVAGALRQATTPTGNIRDRQRFEALGPQTRNIPTSPLTTKGSDEIFDPSCH